jgi:uncharacterized protein (DUF1810 family)
MFLACLAAHEGDHLHMFHRSPPNNPNDPHNLARFVAAQRTCYDQALAELQRGRKRSHWMWYIFPQVAGLGHSSTSREYAIQSRAEAMAYLEHPVLGGRLLECVETVLGIENRTASEIFGYPDDLKLCSCVTLFAQVSPAGSPFEQLLTKYYAGEPDTRTLELLAALPS